MLGPMPYQKVAPHLFLCHYNNGKGHGNAIKSSIRETLPRILSVISPHPYFLLSLIRSLEVHGCHCVKGLKASMLFQYQIEQLILVYIFKSYLER